MREILIVDDDLDMRRLLASVLSKQGYDVAIAKSYGWGILMGKLNQPEIIIADVELGAVTNGVELGEKLSRENPRSKVIIITASSDDELKQRAGELGFRFVEKPVHPEHLLRTVELVCAELDGVQQPLGQQ